MRVWTTNDFMGWWPAGTAAVVVAESEEQARALLEAQFLGAGKGTLVPLDVSQPGAVILADGDY